MRLYKISEKDILGAIESAEASFREGDKRVAMKKFRDRFSGYPLKKKMWGKKTVKVRYDKEVDAAYIQLSSKKPDGAVEMAEGVILHTTSKNEIVAIEIIDAARKIPIKTLYKLEVTPSSLAP